MSASSKDGMKAPSTAYKIVDVPELYRDVITMEGSVRYLEYDWVAGPGAFIYETPGLVHTLVTDHPQGVKLFGWLQGATEFYDEHGTFIETLDVWWFINHYESYCREQGLPINKQLYL